MSQSENDKTTIKELARMIESSVSAKKHNTKIKEELEGKVTFHKTQGEDLSQHSRVGLSGKVETYKPKSCSVNWYEVVRSYQTVTASQPNKQKAEVKEEPFRGKDVEEIDRMRQHYCKDNTEVRFL
jgi:hypothetical protein